MPLMLACISLPSRTNTNVRYHFRSDTQKSVRDSFRRVRPCTCVVRQRVYVKVWCGDQTIRSGGPLSWPRRPSGEQRRPKKKDTCRHDSLATPSEQIERRNVTPWPGQTHRSKDRIVARKRPTVTNERSPLANCHKEASSERVPQNSNKAHFKNPPPRQLLS
ncbi:uncharacterized protein LOC120422029 [Culex pipiens pallens]|uniref:uncharacterized protein LOC120422029 n=1 Tax=Culex pipiens pallens TaxID=42434 RepID=UPI0022AAB5FD|nr:uncharacterized protein LOC120422029 [Culex pipiens pallens]